VHHGEEVKERHISLGKTGFDPVSGGGVQRLRRASECRVGVGERMRTMRRMIGGREKASEFSYIARVLVSAGTSSHSRFHLSTATSNAKGER
jgi:hypothetical protein